MIRSTILSRPLHLPLTEVAVSSDIKRKIRFIMMYVCNRANVVENIIKLGTSSMMNSLLDTCQKCDI